MKIHAFTWAEKYGLKILIDLHTAPDATTGISRERRMPDCWKYNEI
ncbi:hypothetical protein C823_001465 [Eubacterium plexicaudatum ASF492]|nr:hypothetical protein C823_001465 [Eubacterium plexicaudatum ASF492]